MCLGEFSTYNTVTDMSRKEPVSVLSSKLPGGLLETQKKNISTSVAYVDIIARGKAGNMPTLADLGEPSLISFIPPLFLKKFSTVGFTSE